MSKSSATLHLASELIERPSITPDDNGCLDIISERLSALGFHCQSLPFGDVSNLWASYGDAGPLLVFAGHTDVVPPGPEVQWHHSPFTPTIDGDYLYGRGAADMKGSLAAMVVACENFLREKPRLTGRIAFLLTSDEEGVAMNGTAKVMEWLRQQSQPIDWCIIGEPTCGEHLGDIIKNGRRGSLNFRLIVEGHQGHIAYPHLADNPIHRVAPALAELASTVWDNGNDYFPATSFQTSNINGGTGATNVIPGSVEVLANFRFSTEVTVAQLQEETEAVLKRHQLKYRIEWQLSGEPFLTPRGTLTDAVCNAVKEELGVNAELSTTGGTSDGRFIAPYGAEVVELGPINATIHKINECVAIADLDRLSAVYYHCLRSLLT